MTRQNVRVKARMCDVLLDSIRRKCRDSCCCADLRSWKECTAETTCPLWPHRLGYISALPSSKSEKKLENPEGKSLISVKKQPSEPEDEMQSNLITENGALTHDNPD